MHACVAGLQEPTVKDYCGRVTQSTAEDSDDRKAFLAAGEAVKGDVI